MCKSIAISNLTPGEHQGTFWRRLSISGALLFGALDPCHCSGNEVTRSCLTLCNPMDCSLPGSSVHGIFQARVLEWVAISFSWGSSWPKDRTQVSRIVDRCFTIWATREVHRLEIRPKSRKLLGEKIGKNFMQCFISFWCTAKCFSCVYIYIFHILFH